MDTKNTLKLRAKSVSASVSTYAIGKTPLERMYQVVALGRRGRLIAKMAAHGRVDHTRRAR